MKTDRERNGYNSYPVALMDCEPGNWDHPKGEPMSIVTIARSDLVEPLTFTLKDSRTLVIRLLVCLATYDDEFAKKLLDDHFPADHEGDFMWPASGDAPL